MSLRRVSRTLPVEIVWLGQMFTVMDFPCEVLKHHNVVVPLQPHFIVPEDDTGGLNLKYVTKFCPFFAFLWKKRTIKNQNLFFSSVPVMYPDVILTTDMNVHTTNRNYSSLKQFLHQLNPDTSKTFITAEAE